MILQDPKTRVVSVIPLVVATRVWDMEGYLDCMRLVRQALAIRFLLTDAMQSPEAFRYVFRCKTCDVLSAQDDNMVVHETRADDLFFCSIPCYESYLDSLWDD